MKSLSRRVAFLLFPNKSRKRCLTMKKNDIKKLTEIKEEVKQEQNNSSYQIHNFKDIPDTYQVFTGDGLSS
jgi:ABC-type lipoprotein release transport system permease subunit